MLFIRRIHSTVALRGLTSAARLVGGTTLFSLTEGQRCCSSTERWTCSCGFSNFSFRGACFHCHAANPNASSSATHPSESSASLGMMDISREAESTFSGLPPSTDPFSASEKKTGGGFQHREFRDGDWKCRCGAHNFSRRQTCFTCHAPKNGQIKFNIKPGDWICSACNSHNFKSRVDCFSCHAKKPSSSGGLSFPGELNHHNNNNNNTPDLTTPWTCQSCHSMNEAEVQTCHVCTAEKPDLGTTATPGSVRGGIRQRYPNDWICPSCAFVNFQSRTTCKSCSAPKTADAKTVGMGLLSTDGSAEKPSPSGSEPTTDWTCVCGFVNFHFRAVCKVCKAMKTTGANKERGDLLGSKLDEEQSI